MQRSNDQIRLVPLGTSSGIPTNERNVAAFAIIFDGHRLLLDCGEGTQQQLLRAGLGFRNIEAVFISHLHSDHVLGLPGLLNSLNLAGRRKPIDVYGPGGLKNFLTTILQTTHADLQFDLIVIEAKEGLIQSETGHSVRCLPLKHVVETIGYEVEITSRNQNFKISYCSDTIPCANAVELSREADLLIHEATYSENFLAQAHQRGHSTAAQAARIAEEAKVKRLLLTHISPRYKDAAELLEEAKKVFPDTEIAEDLQAIIIER